MVQPMLTLFRQNMQSRRDPHTNKMLLLLTAEEGPHRLCLHQFSANSSGDFAPVNVHLLYTELQRVRASGAECGHPGRVGVPSTDCRHHGSGAGSVHEHCLHRGVTYETRAADEDLPVLRDRVLSHRVRVQPRLPHAGDGQRTFPHSVPINVTSLPGDTHLEFNIENEARWNGEIHTGARHGLECLLVA